MAMTAWLAKVLSTAICLSESGPGAPRATLNAPIAASPRIIGMIVIARKLRAPAANSAGALSTSGMSTILRSRMAVLCMYSRVSGNGNLRRIASTPAGSGAATAAAFTLSLSASATMTMAPGNSLSPLPTMASNTGWVSLSELLMTLSIPEVAVCCSNASLRSSVRCRSSLSSRVFSMAITAWLAKFVTSSICLPVNGRTSWR